MSAELGGGAGLGAADDLAPTRGPGLPASIDIFDTTLRDGAQFEGISLTVEDKLRVAEQLDRLGVRWIEGGYPQANPKDAEFFRRAPTELKLSTADLVAFGSTRRPLGKVDDDTTLRALVEAGVGTACIVGKSWDYHVLEALQTTLDEGAAMVGDSVRFLKGEGLRVFFDAEHFFDGYKANPEFALRVLEAAAVNGADCLVLCDTNGGSLPHDVERITAEVAATFDDVQIGIHTQNDSGCAVANSVAAVRGGATQLQGTVNGYGERTGNANLMTCIPNLQLKLGVRCLPEGRLERLTAVSRHVAELVNLPPHPSDPYVGASAFAHKGGLHTSALGKAGGATYEHIDPDVVGNHTRVLVSDLGGRSGMSLKAKELGVDLDDRAAAVLTDELKDLEAKGFVFEAADASLELLMRRATGLAPAVLPHRGLAGHHLPPPARRRGRRRRPRHRRVGRHRGHRQGVGRRRAAHRGRRGQRSRQRPRHRAAPGHPPQLPGPAAPAASSTSRCGCSTPRRAPVRSRGCSSTPPTVSAPGRPSA